ncbi:hypothetical protein O6H91_06G129200 [Diphasiastrum complanatum]|uniref:Uncharacterized protein n=2 Tax=Diphasiastrum complanatum TaxID=34168 RepID=A0ACC2DIP9_DIPCM|nr:hypothetical protein O6H91_06G129100 [Diphasiastrum complanatum]KAJ7554172.1 hypothetical protein O6H91_06G129200 [Diphasiastrum complanatum]
MASCSARLLHHSYHSSPCTFSVRCKHQHILCKKKERGDREHHRYHVRVVTPPQRNLGIHCLPTNTQCGETIVVKGEQYIVSGVTYHYQLRRGKYEPSDKKLDVQSTGRYILNLFLENLLEKS